LRELRERIVAFASPIAAAETVEALDLKLRTAGSPELSELLAEVMWLTQRHPQLAKRPANLEAILPLYIEAFGSEHAGILRQVFDVSLELADRSAPHVDTLWDGDEPTKERLSDEFWRRLQAEEGTKLKDR
jgi:hypothetical protein